MSRRKYKKKKEEETKVNIEKVNIEIDYDKLAESIVKSKEIAKEKEQIKVKELQEIEEKAKKEEKRKKIGFWEAIKFFRKLHKGEIDTKGEATPMIMPMFTSLMALVFSIIFNILSLLFFIGIVLFAIFEMSWQTNQIITNISVLLLFLAIDIILYVISFMMKIVSNDIEKTKDKHYVLSVFSALAGFGALIVSIIALLK
ncbi:MAG: hypothetical protein IJX03_05045 [Clostridia bacterium]|nr:hypothetical protein [Clostridia bacterium]